MKELVFKEGDIIVKQGAENKDAFFIKSGRVELSTTKDELFRPHAVLDENNVFNEMALIANEPSEYTAVAVLDTVIIVIDRKSLRECLLKSDRAIATAVMFLLEKLKAGYKKIQLSEDDYDEDQLADEFFGDPESLDEDVTEDIGNRYIRITGLSDISKRTLIRGKIDVRRFPFRVGRKVDTRAYTVESSVNSVQGVENANKSGKTGQMDFEIDEVSRPYYVSAHHFYIEKEGDNFLIIDNASRLGLILNDNKVNGTTVLGDENTLILGSQYSPYVYKIEIMNE
ncbi:MAG: cyclic nucleotide-binding domain-containing protein [Candidatus Anammoxibacter sp.]